MHYPDMIVLSFIFTSNKTIMVHKIFETNSTWLVIKRKFGKASNNSQNIMTMVVVVSYPCRGIPEK